MSKYFYGQEYNDDRLYVLYLCKGKVEKQIQPDGTTIICTIIYHENPPKDFIWCLVTYRNDPRYQATRVDHFYSLNDAVKYMHSIEPQTPLISLDGRSPQHPLTYLEYFSRKRANGFKNYDYGTMYRSGGTNPHEYILESADGYRGIKGIKETNKADWVIFDATDDTPAGRYDKESEILELVFRQVRNLHRAYRYYNVPPSLWLDLCNTDDRESFYSEKIKGKFNGFGPLDEHGNPARPIFIPPEGMFVQFNDWGSRPYWFEPASQNKDAHHNQPKAKTPLQSGCSFLFWIIIASWILGSIFTIKAIITGHY